ncbi:MAG: helix-turn-helix transcriptional regulator [Clostridia bacterium]|nr:helix-turn-helix transcriptional regulator [Clostridia bacterium]MBP5593214.1 helix-turn-helix transcriptional regulator [Clostridia bacterium]MBP5649173.1 helix-turn-helix transcriptional regulator [Clostridia bacterium]
MERDFNFKFNRIKSLRQKKNLSQQVVADGIGTSQANLSRWEAGRITPSILQCWKLAAFFGVSLDYLVGKDLFEENQINQADS